MTAYQNNHLVEIEEYYGSLLNDDGLTNQQALGKVKETYGEHGHEYIEDLIRQQEQLDSGIIVDFGVEFKDNLGANNGV
tara:strand:+ start:117 stop:353 length:237 start_codon:yes stop_codon:yes gene_type:complete